MLILTRRIGETLMIGDEVSSTVLGVKGNQVRLGIDAPKHIAVLRKELYVPPKSEGQSTGSTRAAKGNSVAAILETLAAGGETRIDLLAPAVAKAVEMGLLPKNASPEDSVKAWKKIEQVVTAFLLAVE